MSALGRIDRYHAALAAIAAAYVVIFCIFFAATLMRAPVYDLVDWVLHWQTWLSGDRLGYLWAPHNEHRLVWSRLLMLADLEWFAGSGIPFIVVGAILLAMIAAVILRAGWQSGVPERATLCFLLLLVSLSSVVVITGSMPSMGVFLHTSAFAVFSLALLQDPEPSPVRRMTALLCAAAASFGVSGGLLIWPVLMWFCWRRGYRWPWIALLALAGAALVAVYLRGVPRDMISTRTDWPSLVERLDFIIRFLGLPWAHSAPLVWPARLLGAGILVAGAVLVLRDLRRPGTPVEQFGLALMLFAILLASAGAIARVGIVGEGLMPARYSIFVALAHAGLLLALSSCLSAQLQRPAARIGVLALGAAFLVQQVAAGIAMRREALPYSEAWTKFVRDGTWSAYVYPERERALVILKFTQQRGLYSHVVGP